MPQIENNENIKSKYIDREAFEWTREQGSKRNREFFFNATIVIAAVAIYATWAWMVALKIRA